MCSLYIIQRICEKVMRKCPWFLEHVPDKLKTQKMCEKAVEEYGSWLLRYVLYDPRFCRVYEKEVEEYPRSLEYVPDNLKTQEMCKKAMHNRPATCFFIPDRFKTQKMRKKAVEAVPSWLERIPNNFKTQGTCDKAVKKTPRLLEYVPNRFVTQQQIKLWHDDTYYYNDDNLIKWYKGHQKRMPQKASIKEEFLPIAWHPSRWWDWCIPEDEKRATEKLLLTI